ncbi:hypothetical protein M153_4930001947 [Pseudoloma neurophilia]|uniref:Uncharacterized protein n=1 Tax=Pseudoloma neurophilia TaxID=146866 RepID=A0A0R0LX60_9MICR|nr:hypothetical protein M153_4930001947 [Pseudoloma neurophilia]
MLKKLIIFDTPPDFTHSLLNRCIRGSDFIIATLSDNQIKKLRSVLNNDMVCLEDVRKPLDDCLRLRMIQKIDWHFQEKLNLLEEQKNTGESKELPKFENQSEIDEHVTFLQEKFVINTDSSTQIMMNSFICPQILKIFQGSVLMSTKSEFIIHNNLIYRHYLDEIFIWGQLDTGKYYFSNDDKYLVVRKTDSTVLYYLDTMERQIHPQSNRIAFGRDILLLDHLLIELKENAKEIYKPIIEESKNKHSIVNDWVDSTEEELLDHIYLKQFDDIWFAPIKHEFITIADEKLTLYRYNGPEDTDSSENNENIQTSAKPVIVRTNISSDMVKEIQFCENRCFAIISKYINNRLKYFIESYCDYVTVTELTENMDLTFRFSDETFLIGSGNKLEYYRLKNKRFVLMNTVEGVLSNLIDLKGEFYCCVSKKEEILFYKNKELIKSQPPNHHNNVNNISFSATGLFIMAYNQIQLTLFDCNGEFVWNKIFGDLRAVTFFDLPKISQKKKKMFKSLAKDDEDAFFNTFLGKNKDQNVHCFRKKEKTLEEKRKSWLKFLCAL